MGDLVGVPIEKNLVFIDESEIQKIKNSRLDILKKAEILSAIYRINILYMIARSGSGHIGSSFSSIDMMTWLALNELYDDKSKLQKGIFYSSKGHDAPALYSVMMGEKLISFDLIHKLRRIDGLPGHPDIKTPNIVTNTGSLGMGISKAKGMIHENRRNTIKQNIFVLVGDGELQEGQIWESLISASNQQLHELYLIVDHNKLQSDLAVKEINDLGDLEAKFESFGWYCLRCDGNNISEFDTTLKLAKKEQKKPKVIIADTIKGKGVSFMEHVSMDSDTDYYKFHSGAPNENNYNKAIKELKEKLNALLELNQFDEINYETVNLNFVNRQEETTKLIPAYQKEIKKHVENNPKISVLDADLQIDTGIDQIRKLYPNQFIECGIAEQDMVSQAGGIALKNGLPIVHSFACFLSTRPNEQIYNNATEGKKIIYVGSLAGILPAGPGHSHQAVRDIATLGTIPGLTLVEPSTTEEVESVLDWAINVNQKSTYIRLVSIPWPSYKPSNKAISLEEGKGITVREGKELIILTYGPIFTQIALDVAEKLEKHNIYPKVINLPWLNKVHKGWLNQVLDGFKFLVSIDNHIIGSGQGSFISQKLHEIENNDLVFKNIGLEEIPACGSNLEVLNHHKLDKESIYNSILQIIDKK